MEFTFAKLGSGILAVIALFFLAAWFWSSSAEAKESVFEGIDNTLPDIGAAEVDGVDKIVLSEEHQAAVDELVFMMEFMAVSEEACFSQYNGLASYGENGFPALGTATGGTALSFVYSAEKEETAITISGGAQSQLIQRIEIPEVRPCIIAGSEEVSGLLLALWHNIDEKRISDDHHIPVESLIISDDGGENTINYGFGPQEFLDSGYLYTPGNGNVCFFPTVEDEGDVCTATREGLEESCFDEGMENGIPALLDEGYLLEC